MRAAGDLVVARAALVTHARPSVSYCKALGLDWAEAEAAAGGVYMAPIRTSGDFFAFDPQGDEAAVIEVRAADAWTVLDLVAWYPATPKRWFVAVGGAPALGLSSASNRSTYSAGLPLPILPTPEQWLVAACFGAVLLNLEGGVEWLDTVRLTDTVAVESDARAREIDTMRRRLRLPYRHRLMVPDERELAA